MSACASALARFGNPRARPALHFHKDYTGKKKRESERGREAEVEKEGKRKRKRERERERERRARAASCRMVPGSIPRPFAGTELLLLLPSPLLLLPTPPRDLDARERH